MEFKTKVDQGVSKRKRRARETKRGGIATLPVAVEAVGVDERDGGAPSRCGKRRGGRANLRSPHKRPGPRTIDELVTSDITEMPRGQGLETPLHPKRMRRPTKPTPAPPPQPSPSTASTSTSQQYDAVVLIENASVSPVPEIAPPLSPPRECSVPSPVMFVECKGRNSASSTRLASTMQQPPRKRSRL